ncbi:SMAD/FHA domain-containing protein [Suhomyces tanzawaensis NRRL Y-17324]|uniref:RING-type E3 ubiquitin transferase n=1 Tax=Suhomyces tanzawaensis NRRL Y-17324 TaxID=984487 RepID=A0A1E4SHB0_9ASCO|nr:SMAD/FHA domain-containing protein [Suhomyces tanzawaensis NRRL Y-17324]ODV78865.1 SMAD/FHA domain-containing protein [Suhomyces tanzawaensis NRRL Y-17324]
MLQNLGPSSSNPHSHSSPPTSTPTGTSPAQPPPPIGGRRSSFGLNFLSNFNAMRSNHQPASPPTDNTHSFMSNSPTIANLNNYAMSTTLHDEAVANAQSSTTNSDSDNLQLSEPETDLLESEEDRNGMDKDGFFSVRLTPLIDHSSSASGLYFSPVIRKIKPEANISIGRYTEKNKAAAHAPQGSSAPIVFKSKVVSRSHALFQCNEDGQWFLKDCKSSSGTFLNHIRLSPASQESSLMPLVDGDIVQLGMDYRGGAEEVYRCVKMRCEFNKSWQRKVNQFNLEIHKKLKNLQINTEEPSDLAECAICLNKIEPCQALFISPCSHAWHYKCIRPIIIKSYPQFYCPNCRTMCDLETDLDEDE